MSPRLLALLLACVAAAAGCNDPGAAPGGEDVAGDGAAADQAPPAVPTRVEGVLTACVAPTPGVAEPVDGGWEGFDVAVLEEVADHLGVDLELVASSFDEIVSGVALNSGVCDVGAGAVVDREALGDVVTTSTAYRTVHRLVVTTSATSPVPPEEVTGRVGVEQDGPAADVVDALPAAEVVAHPSQTDLARALDAGAVDAALVTPRARGELEAELGVDLSLLAAVPTGDETVLLLPMGADDDLVEGVDGALDALRGAGRIAVLRDRWLRD